MKKYRVSQALKPYIRRLLIKSFHSCRMTEDEDGQIWCMTNMSSDSFHRLVQRAKCEKVTEEIGIFQVTAKEAKNPLLLNLLLKDAGTTTYQVIDDRDGARIDYL